MLSKRKSALTAVLLSCTLAVGVNVLLVDHSYQAIMLSETEPQSQTLKVGETVEVEIPTTIDLNSVEVLSTNPGTIECSALGVDRKLSLKGIKEGTSKLYIKDATNTCVLNVEVKPGEAVSTGKPSDTPSEKPSETPSGTPSEKPSETPSVIPSEKPSETPPVIPSDKPIPPSEKPTTASKIELSSTGNTSMTITSNSTYPTVTRYIDNLDKLPSTPKVTSSDTSVATVSLTNKRILITGKKEGTATISVSCDGLSTVSFTVTVSKNISYDKKISVSSTSVDLYRDSYSTKTVTISNYNKLQYPVQAYTDNSSVATVKVDGDKVTITGVYKGDTKITLRSSGDVTDRIIYVYVYDSKSDKNNNSSNNDSDSSYNTKITDIQLEDGDSSINVKEGKTYTLDVELWPSKVKDTYLKFESSNTRIATVSSSGKVKGIREGSCKVTAYYSKNDMVYDTITVRVVGDDDDDDNDDTSSSKKNTSNKNTSSTSKSDTSNVFKVKTKSGYTVTDPTEIIPYVMGAGIKDISNILGVSEDRLNNSEYSITKDSTSVAFKLDGTVYTCPILTISATGEEKTFRDVPTTHWAHDSIASCTSKGYLEGVGADRYMPSASLNYSATFTALSRALAVHDDNSVSLSRAEVDLMTSKFNASSWALPYYKNILSRLPMEEALRYSQLGDSVMYNTNITRINFANILYNILKDKGIGALTGDKVYNDIAKNDITTFVTERGLMCGDNKGNFNPNGYMTRAELATILLRLDYILG